MSTLIVNLIGVGLIAWIVWYFWLSRPEGSAALVTAEGVQEAFIVVKGGYSPDTLRVSAGRPVRLIFNRQEADPCSEKVVFDAFGLSADLPEGSNVSVEFTPEKTGEYEFACQMGMLRGKVIVESAPSPGSRFPTGRWSSPGARRRIPPSWVEPGGPP